MSQVAQLKSAKLTLYGMVSRLVLKVPNPKLFKMRVKYWFTVAADIPH